jgi:hypothetical protein
MIAYNLNTIKSDQIYILTQNTIKEKSDRSKKKKKKKKKKKLKKNWFFVDDYIWLFTIISHIHNYFWLYNLHNLSLDLSST